MSDHRDAVLNSSPLAWLASRMAGSRLRHFWIALLLAAPIALAVWQTPRHPAPAVVGQHRSAAAPTVPSSAVPPPVEPFVLFETTPERARRINAAVPFIAGSVVPARPFVFAGTPSDRERAVTCLASAVWYEAGDDAIGQRAVAQVVLNRVRHPAFPRTVCGVVFQGADRQTGCQFTFTCDGALVRKPSAESWKRARAIAEQALGGAVEKTVGTATHYHTDWVVPYWSDSLDKIAAVHTHLFFKWRGWWGERGAFSGRYAGGEQLDQRLAYLAGAEANIDGAPGLLATATDQTPDAPATLPDGSALVKGTSDQDLKGNVVRLANSEGTEFGLELDPRAYPGSYAIVAYALCRTKPICTVAGWIQQKQIPKTLPLAAPALRTVSFLYRKNSHNASDEFLWNCRQIARAKASQCLPGTQTALNGKS